MSATSEGIQLAFRYMAASPSANSCWPAGYLLVAVCGDINGDSVSMAANACFTSSDCHAGSDALALMAAMVSLPTRRAR